MSAARKNNSSHFYGKESLLRECGEPYFYPLLSNIIAVTVVIEKNSQFLLGPILTVAILPAVPVSCMCKVSATSTVARPMTSRSADD